MIYGDEMHDKIPGYTATIQEKKLTTLFIPEYATPKKFGANELLSNMLMIGALWHALGLPVDGLIKAGKTICQQADSPRARCRTDQSRLQSPGCDSIVILGQLSESGASRS